MDFWVRDIGFSWPLSFQVLEVRELTDLRHHAVTIRRVGETDTKNREALFGSDPDVFNLEISGDSEEKR